MAHPTGRRRSTEHINPHYAGWNEQVIQDASRIAATKTAETEGHTKLKFRVVGRRIDDPKLDQTARLLVWTGTAGTMLAICAVATMLSTARPPKDRKPAQDGERAAEGATP